LARRKVARRKDWFRPSIDALFGDAAQAVFPLGRFILHDDDRAPGAATRNHKCIAPMKTLSIINPHAAAIDVGSEEFHLSIAGDEPVVFGTVTDEVYRLRDYLKGQGVTTVAMEATGVYWLYAYAVLESAGLAVVVVNGRHVRNLPGRKTDMADCQWLATLHAHGLLRGGFVPPAAIRRLQDYQRLRADHIIGAGSQVQKMQQALERMNIKFHDVISDLVGVSGLKVIRAILAGERNPQALFELCDVQIQKKKRERVLASLRGTWTPEHLFALGQALAVWEFYQKLLAQCDEQIEVVLKELAGPPPSPPPSEDSMETAGKPPGKNAPQIEQLHQLLRRLCGGKDVTAIAGIGDYLLLQLLAETGPDLKAWPCEKHFTAWAGLAPGSRQSGKRKGTVKRQRNRAGRLFCVGARALVQSVDKALGGFYRRLAARKGGLAAMKALARKLAELYYRVLRYGLAYAEQGLRQYEQKYAETQRRLLAKLAAKHGFKLVSEHAEVLKAQIAAMGGTLMKA
jgi:transposase